MCHFCPVEIKNLCWGQGVMVGKRAFCWFCLCFYFFAVHIGSSTLVGKTNMAFAKHNENMRKHNCIWGPVSWYFPVQNNNNKKQLDLCFELGMLHIPKALSKDF